MVATGLATPIGTMVAKAVETLGKMTAAVPVTTTSTKGAIPETLAEKDLMRTPRTTSWTRWVA